MKESPTPVGWTLYVRDTGSWRLTRPIINRDKCTKCLLCCIYCPVGAIFIDKSGSLSINYDFCKGCGICSNECPVKAIEVIKEEK